MKDDDVGLAKRDDGAGRERWVITLGGSNWYHIAVGLSLISSLLFTWGKEEPHRGGNL